MSRAVSFRPYGSVGRIDDHFLAELAVHQLHERGQRYNDPAPLARVAADFPHLRLVAYHGYWPNVQQLLGVAFRHANVFLVPDMYLFLPGSEVLVDAANGFLSEQLLFGSSYPFRPITQSIEDAQRLGLREHVLDKFFYANARQLLTRA